MLEIFSNMVSKEDGEFACMGTVTPGWVSHLGELKLPDLDLRAIKRFLRHAVFGARGLMREYARIREVAEGDARPLRQTSIMQYVVEDVPIEEKPKAKKAATVIESGYSPPIDIWSPSVGGWGRVTWKGSDVCSPPCVSIPPVRLRQQHLGEFGLRGLAPHTSVERTISVNMALRRAVDSGTIVEEGSLDDTQAGLADATWEELARDPASSGGRSERRTDSASSRMRTLFPDPRIGRESTQQTLGPRTYVHPRGVIVSHGLLTTGGAYRP